MSAGAKVLVFGAGQIGVFTARALGGNGAQVWSADAMPNPAFYARYCVQNATLSLRPVDITKLDEVETFVANFDGIDAIVMAAGLTGDKAAADPIRAQDVAIQGVANVLGVARANGINRVVAISSLAIFQNLDGERSVDEDSPACPNTPYGKLIAAFEAAVRQCAGNLATVILRVAGVFGPNRFGYGSHSSRFVERMLYGAALGRPVDVEGYWEDEDDIIYVKDLAAAIASAALNPDVDSVTLNVGYGCATNVKQIAAAVNAIFPAAKIEVTRPLQSRPPLKCAPLDSGRLRKILSISPGFSLVGAMRDYALETGLIDAR